MIAMKDLTDAIRVMEALPKHFGRTSQLNEVQMAAVVVDVLERADDLGDEPLPPGDWDVIELAVLHLHGELEQSQHEVDIVHHALSLLVTA